MGGESLRTERQPNLGPARLTLPSPGCNGPAELGSTRPHTGPTEIRMATRMPSRWRKGVGSLKVKERGLPRGDSPKVKWLLSWVANPDGTTNGGGCLKID